jgi:hypothetical protein
MPLALLRCYGGQIPDGHKWGCFLVPMGVQGENVENPRKSFLFC